MRTLPFCLVVAAAASQAGATECGGGITRDPGFDLWCGEALCAWKLERGDVRRVPTWHTADSGVELLDTDSAIEQFTPVNSHDGTCIRFDLIADVDETAQVELGVDIYGDGSIERVYPIPTARWKPLSYTFAVQPPFTGIRFELAKHGPGRAVVARMRAAVVADGCDGVAGLAGGPAPLGALCAAAADCASGICASVNFFGGPHCIGCDVSKPSCGAGQVCGLDEPGPPVRDVPVACVAAAARALGEGCLRDPECASGVCSGAVCSSCRPGPPEVGCGAAACSKAYDHGPYLCAAGGHLAPRGAPCATSDDCTSAACTGPPRQQCLDGRACASDANCPVDENLAPGPCTIVGVEGGSCD